jgi:hypothetical protein
MIVTIYNVGEEVFDIFYYFEFQGRRSFSVNAFVIRPDDFSYASNLDFPEQHYKSGLVLKFTDNVLNWKYCLETTYNVEGYGATDLRTLCVTCVVFLDTMCLVFSVGFEKTSADFTVVSN